VERVHYKYDFDNNYLRWWPASGHFLTNPEQRLVKFGWQLVCKVARHMQTSLGKSRIGDSPLSSFKFDIKVTVSAGLPFFLFARFKQLQEIRGIINLNGLRVWNSRDKLEESKESGHQN
jgi:hypothetical protein